MALPNAAQSSKWKAGRAARTKAIQRLCQLRGNRLHLGYPARVGLLRAGHVQLSSIPASQRNSAALVSSFPILRIVSAYGNGNCLVAVVCCSTSSRSFSGSSNRSSSTSSSRRSCRSCRSSSSSSSSSNSGIAVAIVVAVAVADMMLLRMKKKMMMRTTTMMMTTTQVM